MALDDIPPFAKVAGIALGLVAFGLVARCVLGGASDPIRTVCNDLPLDAINPCLKRAKEECRGTDDEMRVCAKAIAARPAGK
jgi:predicted membrane chloride channel (bestrophin family)